MLCDQIGIQRSTQVSDVHPSGRTGGKSCSYFTHDVSPLWLLIVLIFMRVITVCGKTAHNLHSPLIIQPQIKMCNKRMCLGTLLRHAGGFHRIEDEVFYTMKNAASYIPVSTRRLYSSAIVWFIIRCCSFQQYNWKLWFSSIGASFNCI